MTKTIARYCRLYLRFLEFSISKAFEFRSELFLRIIMDIVYYAVNIAFFKLIYRHVPTIGGWAEAQTMVFVAIYLVIDAFQMTFMTSNLWTFSEKVNDGSLDYYLVRPVAPLFFLTLREIAVPSFINLLITFGILIWAVLGVPEIHSFLHFIGLFILILNGVLLYYLLALVFVLPVFWTHSGHGFAETFYSFGRFMERPDRIFTGPIRMLVTIVLPFALIASYPARLILEPFALPVLLHLLAVTIGFSLFVRWIWLRGVANYSSASS